MNCVFLTVWGLDFNHLYNLSCSLLKIRQNLCLVAEDGGNRGVAMYLAEGFFAELPLLGTPLKCNQAPLQYINYW